MGMAALLAVLVLVPAGEPVFDQVDHFELNHFYDGNGQLAFDQVLCWQSIVPGVDGPHVVHWWLVRAPGHIPIRTPRGYEARFWQADTLRLVRARSLTETWTQYDPELADREHFPKEKRPGLTRPLSPRTTNGRD